VDPTENRRQFGEIGLVGRPLEALSRGITARRAVGRNAPGANHLLHEVANSVPRHPITSLPGVQRLTLTLVTKTVVEDQPAS